MDELPEPRELSRWARRGSGSACRSIHGGFVEWVAGTSDEDSVARPLAPPEHWDLRDLVVLVSRVPKLISSSDGHRIATTHPFMAARQAQLPGRSLAVKGAIARRDFATLAALVEQEALEMHALMISGVPAALYLQPGTIALIHAIREWREADGVPVAFTLDAGPNVHVLCEGKHASEVRDRIEALAPGVPVLENLPGPAVRLTDHHLI
jgi:diphosphomevalonate decarboxylase